MTGELAGARRVLVVRPDNVGDVVLLTPALRALRAALPDATITLLASPAGARVAPLVPEVDEVWTERVLWQDASGSLPFDPRRERAFVDRLAAGGYDAALVSTSFSQSAHPAAYACYLAGIPLRAGFAPDFAGGVLSHPVPPPPDGTHQADRALALVTGLGAPAAGHGLSVSVPEESAATAADLAGPPGSYLVIAPGASCPSRRYDPERFGAVAARLSAATGLPAVAVGSERERELTARIAVRAGEDPDARVLDLAGRTDVPELAAVVAGARLVVTNNSGPMHIADALRRPMVVLFAGTEREREYAPRSAPAAVLRRPTACAPCRSFTCPYAMECLDVPPGEVVRAGLALLDPTGTDAGRPLPAAGALPTS